MVARRLYAAENPACSRLKNKQKEKRGRKGVNLKKEDLMWQLNLSLSALISKQAAQKKLIAECNRFATDHR